MITFIRADHIHICVPPERLEEARQFYTQIIGLSLIERPKELNASRGYWFKLADIELHIGVEPAGTKTRRHTALEITDIKEARQHLTNNKVQIEEEPHLPGRERFAFIDPFGNKMELLEKDSRL
jgi:catechol 2,3-dioxygenase-like lactoylglutathione lyase family enzyme